MRNHWGRVSIAAREAVNALPVGVEAIKKLLGIGAIISAWLVVAATRLSLFMQTDTIDDDQTVVWSAAREVSQLRFHEPAFYGQTYNTYVEGAVAAPLLWLGAHPQLATFLATTLFAQLPFLILASLAWRQKSYLAAVLVSTLPVLIGTHYLLVTQIPRGFVTGLPWVVGAYAILDRQVTSHRAVLAGLLVALGLYCNPGCILLAPCFLFLLNHHRRSPKAWAKTAALVMAGVLLAAPLFFARSAFYAARPDYVVFSYPPPRFSIAQLREAILAARTFFDDLAPLSIGITGLLSIAVASLCFSILRGRQWEGIALVAFLVLTVGVLGFDRVSTGDTSIWMPKTRMFLAVPAFVATYLTSSLRGLQAVPAAFLVSILSVIPATLAVAAKHIESIHARPLAGVQPAKIREVENNCREIREAARLAGTRYVVQLNGMQRPTVYGCHGLFGTNEFVVLFPAFDRRTWLLEEAATATVSSILVRSGDEPMPSVEALSATKLAGFPDFSVVTSAEPKSPVEFVKTLNLVRRPFAKWGRASGSTP